MEKNIHTLIIPDVHGRVFWKKPVEEVLEGSDAKIIFLGDYLDPYLYEFGIGDSFFSSPDKWAEIADQTHKVQDRVIDNFKSIIELKKKYPDRITLLIGNHDCGYAVSRDICDCRTDRWNFPKIEILFKENWKEFRLAKSITIGGKEIFFSHAGIHKEFAEDYFRPHVNKDNVIDFFNNAWETDDYRVLGGLGCCSFIRGGWGDYGSIVWADVHEWSKNPELLPEDRRMEEYDVFQIFGHSQQEKDPVIGKNFACLDCREAFYLDTDGNIRHYDTDKLAE